MGRVRYGPMTSFGSEGSSRSGNSQRSRGSFRVFGIKRRTLRMTVGAMYFVPGFDSKKESHKKRGLFTFGDVRNAGAVRPMTMESR